MMSTSMMDSPFSALAAGLNISFFIRIVQSLRRIWGVEEGARERYLFGVCLRARHALGEQLPIDPRGQCSSIADLWWLLDLEPENFHYATVLLVELEESELELVFADATVWQPLYWSYRTGPPQWEVAYELLALTCPRNDLNERIKQSPELKGLTDQHGSVYWQHYCEVLRQLIQSELIIHNSDSPDERLAKLRRVATHLQLDRLPALVRTSS